MATAAIPWILTGLGLGGGIFGNRPKTTQQTSSGSSNQTTSGTSATFGGGSNINISTPTLDPLQQSIRDTLLNKFTGLATAPIPQVKDVVSGLVANQLMNINRGSAGLRRQASTNLAGRGLNFSPVASLVDQNINNNRVSQLIQAQNAAPNLELELQKLYEDIAMNRLKSAGSFFSSLPTGTKSEQTSSFGSQTNQAQTGQSNFSNVGTGTDPGNMIGGGIGGLGAMLAYLYGQGAFDAKPVAKPISPVSDTGNAMYKYKP